MVIITEMGLLIWGLLLWQGFACLQGGICLSSMARPVSYERAVAWKVLKEEENAHCICFMFMNWPVSYVDELQFIFFMD